jgi:hypothetical protein
MLLKNISARPHWLGDVLIAPGQTADVADLWRGAFNAAELVEIVEEKPEQPKRGRPAKVSEDDAS